MPFSLLIMAGPSTIRTSASIERGICMGFVPAAAIVSPPALTSRFFTCSSSSRQARA